MQRRMLMAAAALAMLGAYAPAESAPATDSRYVAISLVGDEIIYTGAPETSTGTLRPRGKNQAVPMRGAPFDRTVLEVLAGAVPRARPGAALSFLVLSAPEAFANQDAWFDGDKITLPASLRTAVDKEGASWLLLVTKSRGEAGVADGTTKFGFGKLTGLGFYIDGYTEMTDPKLGTVRGFIAPYVYVKLSVVDLSTSTVTAHGLAAGFDLLHVPRRPGNDGRAADLLVKSVGDAAERALKPVAP